MQAEDFTSSQGKVLTITTEEGSKSELKLEKVEKSETKGRGKIENIRSEPFTIIFSGSHEDQITDQIIEISPEGSEETHKMFLKTLNKTEDRIIYESIIN
ncbi:hypothetical protein NC796_12855 [Aliifodinibius sp. S!AR15-10]|uniref:DUF6916 family protein n=1 Tax=Aliifodinibius sp. S!AR15-10 TaxID=2950437 RepID=UPI002857A2F2|nr:hypothetical protein [Aliifodinibius sp. S!AR15-10]MDR8392039.1 hypothetical protein [Aliifodinibius sp. S!AR15-10]